MPRLTGIVLAAMISLSLQAGQAPPVPTIGTGAISGVVVDGTSNMPLAGVVVFLGPPERRQLGQPTQQLTDDKGRFVFVNLGPQPDGYFINATKPGYVTGHYGTSVGVTAGRTIPLANDEWFGDAKVVMYRQSAITGTITDDQGDPVVGAYVRALTQVAISGTPRLAVGPIVKTDDRGLYRLPNLSPGKYIVNVPSVQLAAPLAAVTTSGPSGGPALEIDETLRLMLGRYPMPRPAADGRPRVYAPAFFPGVTNAGDAQVIELRHGEERQAIDVRLQPVRAVRVSGLVTGAAAGSGLSLRLLAAGTEGLGAGSETATTLVHANGTFTFANVPQGRYTILTRRTIAELRTRDSVVDSLTSLLLPNAPSQLLTSSLRSSEADVQVDYRINTTPTQGGGPYWGSARVDVADQDVTGVALVLQRGITLTGRAVRESGQVFGPGSAWFAEPANGDVVLAAQAVSGTRGSAPPEPGLFTIEGLMPSQYLLRFEGSPTIKSIVWNGRDVTYTPFDASEGRDIAGVVVTITDRRTTLTGSVRDAQGRPATDAIVIAFPAEREQWSNYGFNSLRIKLSPAGTSGAFRYQNLPAGEYFVVAVNEDQSQQWRDPRFLAAASALASRVTLDWDSTKSVDVKLVQVQVP